MQRPSRTALAFDTITALAVALALLSTNASAQPPSACDTEVLETFELPSTRVVSADVVRDDPRSGTHCLIRAAINERIGMDGQAYAIGFEMRLPEAWNGRYFHQANGGNDGSVVPAYGSLLGSQSETALELGYAVLSSDAGHDGQAHPDAGLVGGNLFGLDHQARLDYGYAANVTLTSIAKAIIQGYYGRPPEYSYMVGCSNGGRHALVGATRLASEFDGFLAGAPGHDLPRAALQHAWDVQSFEPVAGAIPSAFSPEDMHLLAGSVTLQCDALDGAADGIVGDLAACQQTFDLEPLMCGAEGDAACLEAAQIEALERSFAGPTDPNGRQLYAEWWYDAGLGANGWRSWKLEGFGGLPLIATLGAGSLAHVFTTPPTRLDGAPESLLEFLRTFDFDRDAPKIFAVTSEYPVSAMDFMAPTDWREPTLAELEAAGGKLIVFHGASDGAFSLKSTIDWYEQLQANQRGEADDFARFFAVPGMGHCSGGPATDRFDLFGALVDWVERAAPPDNVTAFARGDNPELPRDWSANRSRPLCPWPQVARYDGSGDLESAESFSCE